MAISTASQESYRENEARAALQNDKRQMPCCKRNPSWICGRKIEINRLLKRCCGISFLGDFHIPTGEPEQSVQTLNLAQI